MARQRCKTSGFFRIILYRCESPCTAYNNLNNVGKPTGRVIISVRRADTRLFRSRGTVSFRRLTGPIDAINNRCFYIIVSWCGWTPRALPPDDDGVSSSAKIIYLRRKDVRRRRQTSSIYRRGFQFESHRVFISRFLRLLSTSSQHVLETAPTNKFHPARSPSNAGSSLLSAIFFRAH